MAFFSDRLAYLVLSRFYTLSRRFVRSSTETLLTQIHISLLTHRQRRISDAERVERKFAEMRERRESGEAFWLKNVFYFF